MSKEILTPETDALISKQFINCVPFDESANQLAKLCRKLESERNYAINALEDLLLETKEEYP